MKKPGSFQLLIPVIVLSLFSAACAFSVDLGGQPTAAAEPPATVAVATPQPTAEVPAPTAAPTGSIRGKLSYPSEFIPPLRIVAFRLENGAWNQQYVYVDTVLNAGEYQIDGLDEGFYWVVAYTIPEDEGIPAGLAAGYSQAVPCGLSAACTDHSLIAVEVKGGQVTGGVDPGDWYAPEGSFPVSPAQ